MSRIALIATAFLTLAVPAFAAPGDTQSAPTIQAPPSAPKVRPARADSGLTGVMRYDANKDGAVTVEEWKTGQQARFKSLDANNDGKLSQEELFARTPAVGNSILPTDRQAGRQSSYFLLLDTDKDGFVTLTEFMAQADRNFARCDVDKNGRIDTAECRQALQRKPAGAKAE